MSGWSVSIPAGAVRSVPEETSERLDGVGVGPGGHRFSSWLRMPLMGLSSEMLSARVPDRTTPAVVVAGSESTEKSPKTESSWFMGWPKVLYFWTKLGWLPGWAGNNSPGFSEPGDD